MNVVHKSQMFNFNFETTFNNSVVENCAFKNPIYCIKNFETVTMHDSWEVFNTLY